MYRVLIVAAAIAAAWPAFGQMNTTDGSADGNQSVSIMGGRMGASHMGQMLNPIAAEYEDAIVLGAGYQHFLFEPAKDLRVGVELGGAVRIGLNTTGELWGGVVGRYEGWVLGETLNVSPSLVFGVSAVTDTMGIEAQREARDGLSGNILFYFSPEIAFSTVDNPQSEVFWRLHHRSSAWNNFGGGGSANATMLGIRTNF